MSPSSSFWSNHRRTLVAGLLLVAVVGGYLFMTRPGATAEPSYSRDIQPVLASKCYTCHGPDASKREAGLRLDVRDSLFVVLESGTPAVSLERPDESELLRRITSTDPDYQMPPPDAPKPLEPGEVEALTRWVAAGVPWENHWAFEPLADPPVPDAPRSRWARTPVDSFILAALEKQGLGPSPEADKRTLLRRLTFDLHGLPPTPEELEDFLADEAPDAYERVVDRLLASPRYGERWARHWLDVAHYGETHGYDKDKRRENAWPYRDYVIDAFNRDLPYGRFVEDQVAGDVLHPNDPASTVALGFLAAGPWDFVGHVEVRDETKDKRIVRNLDRDDMVSSTMATFASVTVQCARCHDHKFDPITQADYYSLQAVFAGVERADRPFDADPALHALRTRLSGRRRDLEAELASLSRRIAPSDSVSLVRLRASMEATRRELAALRTPPSPSDGYRSRTEQEAGVAKWVQVDLGAAIPIDEIRLAPTHPADDIPMPGYGFPTRFKVEAALTADFTSPISLADFTDADHRERTDVAFVIPVAGVSARFVRVTATRLWKGRGMDHFFALSEVQIFSGGTNVARGQPVAALDRHEGARWHPRFLVDGFNSRRRLEAVSERDTEWPAVQAALRVQDRQRQQELALYRASLPPEDGKRLDAVVAGLGAVRDSLDALPEPARVYAAATDFPAMAAFTPPAGIRQIHLLSRGDTEQPGEPVPPGTISALDGLPARFDLPDGHSEGARRAALATWLVDERNVLTWRSIVNRVWHYHFGRGIVGTPNDFGKMGDPPTHPELLDWLARYFLDNGQSIKALHRLIVTSSVYRQASVHDEAKATIDSGNRYLWRGPRRQLEAEALRDAVLAVSGRLDLTMGGPGFDTFRYEDDHSPRYHYSEYDPTDAASFRRSIYRFVVRSVPDPFIETLDGADPSQSVPVRNETVTALQALSALNNPFMVRQAAFFADRLEAGGSALDAQIDAAFQLALQRAPAPEEWAELAAYAGEHGLAAACRLIFAMNEFIYID